ncbi:MAG TPA: NYN domain-containing protein [Patescibacteria group bacterium]|nr:NYN domain-containing protein [Patescibacteria group bacterium]
MSYKSSKLTYAFVDASNLFYGGVKSLGWKIDYQKLIAYIRKEYGVSKVFYYAGIELNGFDFSPLSREPIDLNLLISFSKKVLRTKKLNKERLMCIMNSIDRAKFYRKLDEFGYILKLKPLKIFRENGRVIRKANCDVDMTFDLMRLYKEYKGVLILSGDGDFAVVLNYLRETGKNVRILARGERTAKEIKQLAGGDFRDFTRLKMKLEFSKK